MSHWFVYILRSLKDESLYVGTAKDVEKRLGQHNAGQSKGTRSGRPYILVHSEAFASLSEARQREWFLKNTPGGGKLKGKLIEEEKRENKEK